MAPPNPEYEDRPYTLQPGKCGEHGKHIHLTPNYLITLNEMGAIKRYGSPGKGKKKKPSINSHKLHIVTAIIVFQAKCSFTSGLIYATAYLMNTAAMATRNSTGRNRLQTQLFRLLALI